MTDLTAFASLPLNELTAELDRMLANHHAPMRSYASRQSPTVTRSGTGVPSPADIAACGELIEDRA
jgi:hypothetical protein